MKTSHFFIAAGLCSVTFLSCDTKKTDTPKKSDEESLLSIMYQQDAGEYHALCLQAYNLAKRQITEALKSKGGHKPFAVIADLDETVLDNSDQEIWLYQHDSTANFANLYDWWLKGKAKAVPGSLDFFKFAKANNIDIYYISNREDTSTVVNATRENMKNLGFPYTDNRDFNNHFLFQGPKAPASKESRRLVVAKSDSVIVLLGDNLIDLDKAFDKIGGKYQDNEKRIHEVDSLKSIWGARYIVFPNSIYGDWESAFYQKFADAHSGKSPTQAQKDSVRATLLHSY
jgi:5'-nucleotidase (lipoprotein e(P4) family)